MTVEKSSCRDSHVKQSLKHVSIAQNMAVLKFLLSYERHGDLAFALPHPNAITLQDCEEQ